MRNKVFITKQQAIEDLVYRMEQWDINNIINYATFHYRNYLQKCKIDEIKQEYMVEFNILKNDEEQELEIIDNKATKILFDKKD